MQLKKIRNLFFLFIIFSCSSIKNEKIKPLFKKITFTTGLCFGTCPQTAGYIDDSLNFYFFGGLHAEKDSLPDGYYKSKISDTLWDQINDKAIGLEKFLDSSWEVNVDGWPIEINFTDRLNRNRKISGEPDAMPNNIYFFVDWLQKISRKIQLQKITDSTFFQATNIKLESFRSPPPPPNETIKFIPPKKKKP